MANVWTRFAELLPSRTQQIGEVTAVNTTAGTSTLTLPTGDTITVIGTQAAVGKSALIEGGRIITEVPTLSTYDVDV